MATVIKSMSDLTKILEPRIVTALEMTRDELFEVISKKVFEYYEEPVFESPDESEPDYYQRTYELMESLTASHVTKNEDGYEFTVGWDDEYLTFRYPGGFISNSSGTNRATGSQVLDWFNSASHGGTIAGSHRFWDEAISELGGQLGIIDRFKINLQKYGIPVK